MRIILKSLAMKLRHILRIECPRRSPSLKLNTER